MSKITIPTQEFEPVSATILGAIDGIPREFQDSVNDFRSNFNGEDFIVRSYERPMTSRFYDLRRKKFVGSIAVSLKGVSSARTSLFYGNRIKDQGLLVEAETSFGGITDPEEFAQAVKSADYSQVLDLYTSMDPFESEEIKRKHGPIIEMAKKILDRDGVNKTVYITEGTNHATDTRRVDIDTGIKFQILQRPSEDDLSDVLSIWTEELNADGDYLEKAYIITDKGFIEQTSTRINGHRTTGAKDDFLLISDEDLKRMYKVLESQL